MNTASPIRRLAVAAGLLIAVLVACGRELTGPGSDPASVFRRFAALSFEPKYETALPASALRAALTQVAFERVRITLRNADGSIALDTVVTFPVGSDSLTLTLNVPLPPSAPAAGVPLSLSLGYVNAAGDTVFKGGPIPITVVPTVTGGTTPPPTAPVQIPVQYTGPGASATRVAISPKTVNGTAGQAVTFSAQAQASDGSSIAGTPIVFVSSNSAVVTVNETSGAATLVGRGSASVIALLLTGPRDSATVSVTLPAAQLALGSGGNQTGPAGSTLPTAIIARVLASDGVGVSGTTVTFAASGGGTATPASAVSDGLGNASTQWKLGPTAGAQTLTVTAAGLAGSPLTVNATAQAVIPTKLVVQTGPVSGKAGVALPAITVAAQDAGSNLVTTFTGDVTVAIGTNPGSATLSGTTTVKAVAGVATFSDLKLDRPGTGYTLLFSSSGLASAASGAFNITAGDAAKLLFGPMPAAVDAGISIAPPITVSAQDAAGNAVSSFTGAVTIAVGTNPGSATLGGTLTRNAVAGVATFDNLTLNKSGVGYTLTAAATGLTSATSAPFSVTPGAPAVIAVVSGGAQTAAVGSALSPITVQLRDALGNGIGGLTLNFAVTAGGGSVSVSSAKTDAGGNASFGWTLGSLAGTQTVSVMLSTPSISTVVSATGVAGAAAKLVISTAPSSTQTAGVALAPSVVVQAKDTLNAVQTGFTNAVTATIASGPVGATLGGTATVNAVAGAATFSALRLTKKGTYTITFSATGLTSTTTSSFVVNPAPAKTIAADSGNAQSGNAGSALAQQLVVVVTDSVGNRVPSAPLSWAVTAGGGSVTGSATTDTSGRGRATWTLGGSAGSNAVQVTSAGLTGSPVSFTATGVAAVATQLAISRQPRASSVAGQADTIIVHVKDAGANLVTGSTAGVKLTIASGPAGASVIALDSVAAVAGVATFNGVAFDKVGTYTLTLASSGITSATSSSFNVTVGWPKFIVADSGQSQTGSAGQPLTSAIVAKVIDQYGNKVTGRAVAWGTPTSGGSLAGTTTVSDTGGRVRAQWSLGLTAGPQSVIATAADTGMTTNAVTFNASASAVAYNKLWTGAVSTAWATAGNWSPSGVPAATDSVKIGTGVNYPVLAANTTVAGFSMDPSTTMSLATYQLTVNGSIGVQATGFSGGAGSKLILGGTSGSIVGFYTTDVSFSGGAYTLSGGINVTGNVAVTSGSLAVNNNVTVSGDFSTSGTGVVNQSAGTISVGGNVSLGGTGFTTMVGGTLAVAGNFTASSTAVDSMAPPHVAKFNGGSAQVISLASGSNVRFSNVEFSGAGAKSLAAPSQMIIDGTGFVLAGSGAFTGPARTVLRSVGIIDATSGSWNVDTIFVGASSVTQLPASLPAKHFEISAGDVTLSTDLSLPNANVVVYGLLNPNGKSLTIGKDLRTFASGVVIMQSGSSQLTVVGNAIFNGGSTTGLLTAGTLTLLGNFAQSANPAAFAASGSHSVRLAGTATQNISFANPDTANGATCAASCFGNLTIGKASGDVWLLTASNVRGNLAIDSATSVSAIGATGFPRVVTVKGNTSTASGTGVYFTRFSAKGLLALDTTTVIDSIGYGGTASQIMLHRQFEAVSVTGTPTLNSDLTVLESMAITSNGVFDPNGHTVIIGQNLLVASGGRLAGSDPADSLDISNTIQFSADAGISAPSDGKMVVHGDFALLSGSAIQATGNHTVIFAQSSEAAQIITGAPSRVAGQGLHHAVFKSVMPIVISGEINFLGNVLVQRTSPSSPAVTGPGAVVGIGGTFVLDTIYDTSGIWQVDSTEFWGTSITASVITTKLAVTGHLTPTQDFQVNGNLTASGASGLFELGGHGVSVIGDFATRSGGVLKMTDQMDYLGVMGAAIFAGGSSTGKITAGYMELFGDFIQGGGAPDAFAAADSVEIDVGTVPPMEAQAAMRAQARANVRTMPLSSRGSLRALRPLRRQMDPAAQQAVAVRRTRMLERHETVRAAALRRHPFALGNQSAAQVNSERARLHRTTKSVGSYTSVIHFDNPCTADPCGATSYFGWLYLIGLDVQFDSDVWATGQFSTGPYWYTLSSTSASQHTVTSHGADVSSLEFDNIRWVLLDGSPIQRMDNVIFDYMDPTVTQFTIQRAGEPSPYCDCSLGWVQLYSWSFYAAPTTGYYISATDTRGATPPDPLYLAMDSPYPTVHGGHVQLNGNVQTNWPANFAWDGNVSNDWSNGANWNTGVVPGLTDDVTIPAGRANYPLNVGGPAEVHNLTIEAGATIDLNCRPSGQQGINVYGNVVSALGAEAVSTCEGEGLNLKGDGSPFNTIVGNFSIAYVYGNYKIAGPGSQFILTDQLIIDNSSSASANLTVNGGRLDVGTSGLYTENGATLTMTNAADRVFVNSGGAYFYGGSTAGLLTAGRLEINTGVLNTCGLCGSTPGAFAPSGTHTTVFTGPANTVTFDPAVPSAFQNVEIDGGTGVDFVYDAVINGTLAHGAVTGNAGLTSSGANLLTVSGLNQTGATTPMTFTNLMLKFVDGTSNGTFNNAIFEGFSTSFGSTMFEFQRETPGTYSFSGLTFSGTLGSTGLYLRNSATQTVTLISPTPTAANAMTACGGGCISYKMGLVTWP